MKRAVFGENSTPPLISRVNSQGLVHSVAVAEEWIGAKRKPLTRGAAAPCLVRQWVRFVSTETVREGVESLFLWKKRGFICPQNQWLPEHEVRLFRAQRSQKQCQKQWQGLEGFCSPFFTIYNLLLQLK